MYIEVDGKKIGDGYPCYTIAEVGSNFDGDIKRAKMLIDIAKKAGADAVKFQSFLANKIVSEKGFEGLKVGFQSKWDKPVYEVYQNAEFPREWTKELFEYSKSQGITFFSSPYDFEAVDILEELDIPAYKIGSGDITWHELIKYIAEKGRPIILGTGASTMDEIKKAVDVIRSVGNEKIILLQCVTNYPSTFENANISVQKQLRDTFGTLVGYSDHTPGYVVPMGSVALGGCIVEKHFTDDKTRPGPDHPFAMDYDDFKIMVDNIRALEKSIGKPEKDIYSEESETVILQRRCVRAKQDIKAGTVLSKDMLEVLRPAPKNTFKPFEIDEVIGKTIKEDLNQGYELTRDMI